jgi:prepilin-type N-terminal cleavage/methylation domain-containing protein
MKKPSTQSGFSLVETLVAITILLIVITGPLAISSSAAKSSSFSSEQVTAFFLAQEGVELVEKARDDLLVPYYSGANPDPWADFINTTGSGLYQLCKPDLNATPKRFGCDLTINNGSTGTLQVAACLEGGSNCLLYIDKANSTIRSRYTHTSSATTVNTPFTRTITLEQITPDEVKVVSKVTWRTGALKAQQEVFVESRLFNIYGY